METSFEEIKRAVGSFLGEYYTGRRPEGDAITTVGYQRAGSGWELRVGLREVIKDPARLEQEYAGVRINYVLRMGEAQLR